MSSECLPGTRKCQIETLVNWIETHEKTKPLFVVLGLLDLGNHHFCERLRECARKRSALLQVSSSLERTLHGTQRKAS